MVFVFITIFEKVLDMIVGGKRSKRSVLLACLDDSWQVPNMRHILHFDLICSWYVYQIPCLHSQH